MVLLHVSALVAAQGPARMRVDRAQVRRWLVRAALLWLGAAPVWADGRAPARTRQADRLVYAAGLALLAAVAVVTTRLIAPRRSIG